MKGSKQATGTTTLQGSGTTLGNDPIIPEDVPKDDNKGNIEFNDFILKVKKFTTQLGFRIVSKEEYDALKKPKEDHWLIKCLKSPNLLVLIIPSVCGYIYYVINTHHNIHNIEKNLKLMQCKEEKYNECFANKEECKYETINRELHKCNSNN